MSGCGASAPPTSPDTYWSVEQINPDGTVAWLHQDQLGSIRLATSATTANTVSTRTWDAYGKPKTTSGTITALLGYAGQYTDTETGFQYLRARYYDPTTGQFLTRDSLEATTSEPYGYTGGNPLNRTDPPSGMCWGPTCVVEDAVGWVDDHRHGIIDAATTIGAVTVAAGCGLTVVCGVAVVGVGVAGVAVHSGWDAISDDDHDISGWDAISRSTVNTGVGTFCGFTFGQGCGAGALGRNTSSRAAIPLALRWMYRTPASMATGRATTAVMWGSMWAAERAWRFATDC